MHSLSRVDQRQRSSLRHDPVAVFLHSHEQRPALLGVIAAQLAARTADHGLETHVHRLAKRRPWSAIPGPFVRLAVRLGIIALRDLKLRSYKRFDRVRVRLPQSLITGVVTLPRPLRRVRLPAFAVHERKRDVSGGNDAGFASRGRVLTLAERSE